MGIQKLLPCREFRRNCVCVWVVALKEKWMLAISGHFQELKVSLQVSLLWPDSPKEEGLGVGFMKKRWGGIGLSYRWVAGGRVAPTHWPTPQFWWQVAPRGHTVGHVEGDRALGHHLGWPVEGEANQIGQQPNIQMSTQKKTATTTGRGFHKTNMIHTYPSRRNNGGVWTQKFTSTVHSWI